MHSIELEIYGWTASNKEVSKIAARNSPWKQGVGPGAFFQVERIPDTAF